jgi:biopolymer transport protein ExbD
MTETDITGPSRHKAGVQGTKRATLKIDMTPMVDLGFLLISFFIFTTEISKPAITNLYMPKEGGPIKIPATKSLTFLLSGNDDVFYYSGNLNEAVKSNQVFQISYSEIRGIGFIIRQKQNELINRNINKKELIVLIKPYEKSSYKNVVSALDEMLINGVSRYMIADLENDEKTFLELTNRSR